MMKNNLFERLHLQLGKQSKHIFHPKSAARFQEPIIVLGNQKSGTSVIAHLLADYGHLSKTIDIPPLWEKRGAQVIQGQRPFADVVRQHGRYFATAVIKEPMMTFFTTQVICQFPQAKYVFVVRDPRDNIRSQLNRRYLPGNQERLERHQLARLSPNSVLLSCGLWGGHQENYIGVLASRWNLAVDHYLCWRDRMLLMRYEEFLRNKHEAIVRLATKLNIQQQGEIHDKLDTPYQPPGDNTLSWQQYYGAANLSSIHRICHKNMQKLGYDSQHGHHSAN